MPNTANDWLALLLFLANGALFMVALVVLAWAMGGLRVRRAGIARRARRHRAGSRRTTPYDQPPQDENITTAA